MKNGPAMHTILPLILLVMVFTGGPAGAEEIVFETQIDWINNVFRIEAKIDLASQDSFVPLARAQSEQLIEQKLPIAFRENLAKLRIDSFNTAGELAKDSPELVRAINSLTYRNTKTFSHISTNLQNFSVTYTYKLFPDIIDIFVFHKRPYKPPRVLSYVPTTDFSGIVIYMKDSFPVHGERKQEKLRPCLFPKIYNEEMDLIYEKGMVEPEVLRKWGMAAYSSSIDEAPYTDRIGKNPLRLLGRGIFGKNYTDIIIDSETADEILFSENNRHLLAEGKVLIIYDPISR